MNPLMRDIFEAFHDGVAVVSPEGLVRYVNASGAEIIGAMPGRPLVHAKLNHAIEQLAKGYQMPPLRVPLEVDGSGQIATQAILLRSPVGTDFVIVLRDLVEENFYRTTLDNFYAYVTTDLADPIDRYAGRLESVERLSETIGETERKGLADAAAEGRTLASHLRRIKDLAQLFGHAPLMADERLPLQGLLEFALSEFANSLTSRRVELKFSVAPEQLPPIYGSREWLGRAIAEFLDNAAKHTHPEGHVEIKAHVTGTHVALICRNQGPTLGSRARERIQTPFNAPPGSKPGAAPKAGAPRRSARIGLAICRKILELHGGAIKITEGDENDIMEFVMELPTGAPTRDTHLLDIAQAQRYASDMARLMARRAQQAKPAPTPGDATTTPNH
ncbi:MAG TPA: PAS domain-containing sensor histidine kinase [Rhodocyclaceae bacterium]|mgnify:CR=1 FL=1|nr:hypothetical protein [Rhodocyclaceae bacterium]HMV52964.1 PAS domain-containing sensor histidine kinase [Rhodocyclaceae bacterium]HMZ83242.1 PAS domain-containing sensor histidine kinase [Rhodocyclaceae bacterium]HNA03255.1 PAS domain-containing sensor histidine kinase [Rhodocyclaceae bacterium]HNB78537.1 PAS domain-containing sensor histidine kinase [Rhodocyclaceae bacterium]